MWQHHTVFSTATYIELLVTQFQKQQMSTQFSPFLSLIDIQHSKALTILERKVWWMFLVVVRRYQYANGFNIENILPLSVYLLNILLLSNCNQFYKDGKTMYSLMRQLYHRSIRNYDASAWHFQTQSASRKISNCSQLPQTTKYC